MEARRVVRSADKISGVTCLERATVCAHTQTTQFTDRIDRQRHGTEVGRRL